MPTGELNGFTLYSEVGEPIEFSGTLTTTTEANEKFFVLNPSHIHTISISDINTTCTITGSYEPRHLRLHCEYCGCVSGKDYGTCEHCGAPLVPMEYYI